MQHALGLPFMIHPLIPEFLTQDAVAEVAQAAEAAGFGIVAVTEHPIPSDEWLAAGGHDALDPFVSLSFAAAATRRLKLLTNLTVVPYRNPFLLAKSAASLDRLSGGRLILGCGTGYLKEEFDAMGVDFEERNALFDESLEVLRKTWKSESVVYKGRHFEAVGNTANPAPAQAEIPIWIGGNSKRSRRRVAERCQGWMPMPNPRSLGDRRRTAHIDGVDDLREGIAYLKAHAEQVGRDVPLDVFYPVMWKGAIGTPAFDTGAYRAHVQQLADAGVTWVLAPIGARNMTDLRRAIDVYAEQVIAKTR
ncbi:MAG: LLM class F420-dependent oxidoreductase [Myxococcota bacterium]